MDTLELFFQNLDRIAGSHIDFVSASVKPVQGGYQLFIKSDTLPDLAVFHIPRVNYLNNDAHTVTVAAALKILTEENSFSYKDSESARFLLQALLKVVTPSRVGIVDMNGYRLQKEAGTPWVYVEKWQVRS